MLLVIIISYSLIFLNLSCNVESEYVYHPANPPVGIKLCYDLTDDNFVLLFRSQNVNNDRFGGYIIFMDPSEDVLKEEVYFDNMNTDQRNTAIKDLLAYSKYFTNTEEWASYTYITESTPLSGPAFNRGMNNEIEVVFTETDVDPTNDNIPRLLKDASFDHDQNYLTLRTYLIDSNDRIIRISSPGNVVQVRTDVTDCSIQKFGRQEFASPCRGLIY